MLTIVGCAVGDHPDLNIPTVEDELPLIETNCVFPDVIDGPAGLQIAEGWFDALEVCQLEFFALLALQDTHQKQYQALVEQYNVLTETVRLREHVAEYELSEERKDKWSAITELWVTRAILLGVVAL